LEVLQRQRRESSLERSSARPVRRGVHSNKDRQAR
jgi:hypothetical protein